MSNIITYEVSAEYVKNNSTIDYEAEKKLLTIFNKFDTVERLSNRNAACG